MVPAPRAHVSNPRRFADGFPVTLDSLPWVLPTERNMVAEWDPMAKRPSLPTRDELLRQREVNIENYRNDSYSRNGFYETAANTNGSAEQHDFGGYHQDAAPAETRYAVTQARGTGEAGIGGYGSGPGTALLDTPAPAEKRRLLSARKHAPGSSRSPTGPGSTQPRPRMSANPLLGLFARPCASSRVRAGCISLCRRATPSKITSISSRRSRKRRRVEYARYHRRLYPAQ